MKISICSLIAFTILLPISIAEAEEKIDQAKLEKQLAEKLSGSKLEGYWTLWNKETMPKKDSYVIDKVTKLKGDDWRFDVRIRFLNVDVKVPITVQVKWAGDTPVITVDKVNIPAIGVYSTRLVIQGDHYAATWDGGDHGGYMFGKIVKLKKEKAKKKQ